METTKGFFAGLFDLSFRHFITIRIIKVLYVLAIVSSVLIGLAMLFTGFGMLGYGVGAGLFQILFAPFVTLFGIIWSRVLLEIVVVLFSIADNTTTLVEIKQRDNSTQIL